MWLFSVNLGVLFDWFRVSLKGLGVDRRQVQIRVDMIIGTIWLFLLELI